MWSLLETSSAVVALIVAFCPPSSFSRLIAPGPNFPLVNYLRHNGHSLRRPDFAQAVVVASAAARAAKTKIICPRVSPWIAAVVVAVVHVDKNGPFPASV